MMSRARDVVYLQRACQKLRISHQSESLLMSECPRHAACGPVRHGAVAKAGCPSDGSALPRQCRLDDRTRVAVPISVEEKR